MEKKYVYVNFEKQKAKVNARLREREIMKYRANSVDLLKLGLAAGKE